LVVSGVLILIKYFILKDVSTEFIRITRINVVVESGGRTQIQVHKPCTTVCVLRKLVKASFPYHFIPDFLPFFFHRPRCRHQAEPNLRVLFEHIATGIPFKSTRVPVTPNSRFDHLVLVKLSRRFSPSTFRKKVHIIVE